MGLPLVLFLRFWLVFCLLDFGLLLLGVVVVLMMVMVVMRDERKAEMRRREKLRDRV